MKSSASLGFNGNKIQPSNHHYQKGGEGNSDQLNVLRGALAFFCSDPIDPMHLSCFAGRIPAFLLTVSSAINLHFF